MLVQDQQCELNPGVDVHWMNYPPIVTELRAHHPDPGHVRSRGTEGDRTLSSAAHLQGTLTEPSASSRHACWSTRKQPSQAKTP